MHITQDFVSINTCRPFLFGMWVGGWVVVSGDDLFLGGVKLEVVVIVLAVEAILLSLLVDWLLSLSLLLLVLLGFVLLNTPLLLNWL